MALLLKSFERSAKQLKLLENRPLMEFSFRMKGE